MENSATKSTKQTREENPKDAKQMEQLEKSFGIAGNATTDEKYKMLMKKVTDLDKDNKRLNVTVKQQEKQYEALQRERENLQKDYNKNVLMKTKLEQVCREQQKLLKSMQNESLKHKETQSKFQHSINEISLTLNKNNDENIKLKEDNIEMTKKLKYLAEQYKIREKQLEKINEQVQLETQLHEAKLAKIQMEATMEKEILLREKQGALDDLLKCKKAIQEMHLREDALKEQLNLYTSKYDDFQNSLQKSNDIFSTYKVELEKMQKKTKKLEKESADWKRKCEKSTASLLDLATEKQVKDEYIGKTQRQMQQLQKLLRTMQAERTTLHKTLKENNIDIPPMPVLPPEPEPVAPPQIKPQPDKMETMAKSCAELKQSLALLQTQMSALTTKQKSPAEPAVEPAAPTKSKNKKNKSRNNKSCPIKDRNVAEAETSQSKIDVNPPTVESNSAPEQSVEVAETVAAEVSTVESNSASEQSVEVAETVAAEVVETVTAEVTETVTTESEITNSKAEVNNAVESVIEKDKTNEATPPITSPEFAESELTLQNGTCAEENITTSSEATATSAEPTVPA